jgi:hypothetical protein
MMEITDKLKKRNRKLDRKWLLFNAVIVLAFLIAVILLGMYGGMQSVTSQTIFADNVTINGHEMGGMTYDEGLRMILQEQNERLNNIHVVVIYNGQEGSFGYEELGVSGNAELVLREAYTHNKQDVSLLENFEKGKEELDLSTEIFVDEQKLQTALMEFLQQYHDGSGASGMNGDTQTFTFTDEQYVFAADLQEIISQVLQRIFENDARPVVV